MARLIRFVSGNKTKTRNGRTEQNSIIANSETEERQSEEQNFTIANSETDGRMDGWIDGWMDERTDGRMGGGTDGWTDQRTNKRMDGEIETEFLPTLQDFVPYRHTL